MKKIMVFLLMLPAVAGYAQVKNLRFYHLSVEDGLPKRTSSTALQDKYGYIWAGTSAGLVRYDGYHAKVYLTKLGIGFLSGVSNIYQDHEGTLWVGTLYKGLFRYDRTADTFRQCIYYPEDSGANNVTSIREDGSGNIWAISANVNRSYLNCFNKKTRKWQHFSYSDTGSHHIAATQFYSLLEDHAGRIWMTTNKGLYEYDSTTHRLKGYLKLSQHSVGVLILYEPPSEPGILWMDDHVKADREGFFNNGLIRFNTKDHSFTRYRHRTGDISSLGTDEVFGVWEDKENRLWIGTSRGISLFDPQAGRFANYSFNVKNLKTHSFESPFSPFREDKKENLWYDDPAIGLFYFNTKNKTFTPYPAHPDNPESLQDNDIKDMFTDRTGTLWLAEVNEGLQWINKKASLFTVYPDKNNHKGDYSYGSVNCYTEDDSGNIWLGTNNGLVYWNRHAHSFKHINLTYANLHYNDNSRIDNSISYERNTDHSIFSIIRGKNNIVWFGGNNGLFRYDPVTGNLKNYLIVNSYIGYFIYNQIDCLYQGHEGKIWIGTAAGGLCSLDPLTGKITRYPYSNYTGSYTFHNLNKKDLSSNHVLAIYEDRKGTLWIGTSRGLDRFNRKDSTFTTFMNFPKGLTRIRTIGEDKNGSLWLGTWEGGLFHFNPETDTFQQFSEKQGLLFNAVYNCLEDSSGRFWITSPRGITLFNPKNDATHPITITSGLPSVHIDYGGFKTREGDFMVTTSNGFIEFNPDQYHPDRDPPLIHIETISFTKSQKDHNASRDSALIVFGHNKFDLNFNENRLIFHYVGIHYQNPDKIHYAYKLDGYDKNWIQAGTERSVTYTNLSPGTYTFWVKAANSDGVWSKATSIMIIISPPWWEIWWAYIIYAIIIIAFVWRLIAYRSRNLKRKNQLLEQKVSLRTNELRQSLENLQSTQKQLIQSEKMASLGELTAGIAHEIQNPLNFVNNFSEVNTELIDELKAERLKPKAERSEKVEDDIINDIKGNSEKIIHHGKRADAIVKGMLQHSRGGSGERQPTNINALADEYSRLSYHGMRAKDKTFNATMKTDFDETIGKINVVPQDIGRVLLNLFNNAFYAVAEKKKDLPDFVPIVTVVTKKIDDKIEIKVSDNGNGIPEKIKDKIFQPFFTTKPTGEGTGLGLSLSYDMIKAQDGDITVNSKEGEGTEFVIILPV